MGHQLILRIFCSLRSHEIQTTPKTSLNWHQEGKWGTTDDIRDWLHGDGVRLKVKIFFSAAHSQGMPGFPQPFPI